jgi:hypothetical protein
MIRQSFWRSGASFLSSALLILVVSGVAAFGQAGTSSIDGTVADPQGNLVAGATVTLTNAEKNFSRTQTTNDSGRFAFNLIQPGQYQLEVEAPGFKKAVVTNIDANVDKPTEVSAVLEVGSVSETVTVAASAAEVLLNTQDATLGNNFVNQQITQLPLEARNPIALLTLQPGVTRAGNVTGARSDQSNITLDGIDINESQTNAIGDPVLRLNAEAVEEFRVVTQNANSSQGRSSGAQISLITKSGSNEWHAAAFWAHRNTIFTANNFFFNRSGIPRPVLLRNTYGGALGGPIKRDKLFFFYSYEGRRDASQAAIGPRTVPLPHLGRGEVKFQGCPPGVSPCTAANSQTLTLTPAQLNVFYAALPALAGGARLNPVGLATLAAAATRYPANDFNTGDKFNTAGYRFSSSTPVDNNSHQVRLDYNLTDTQQLFVRGSYQYDKQPVSFTNPQQFPDTPQRTRWYHPWGLVVGHTWAINSAVTNNFRIGLTRLSVSDQGDTGGNFINFRFVYDPTTASYTTSRINPVYNITDDLSWVKGSHTMQFGTNIRLVRNKRAEFLPGYDSAITNPFFYQSSGQALLDPIVGAGYTILSNNDDLKAALTAVVGRLSQYTAKFNFGLDGKPIASGEPLVREFATEEYDLYVQDSWKVNQNLTLTLGLRYGLSKPVYETQGYMAKPNIPLGQYLEQRIASARQGINYIEPITVNLTDHFYDWDKNNFQPRIAAAWSPDFGDNWFGNLVGRKGKSVIRGGFAITNDYFGQQLAVTFNSQNQLGFSSSQTTPTNTYNLSTRPAPLFTGFGQDIRSLPNITIPGDLVFPQQRSASNARRIESSLDGTLVSPINYTWNVSYQRDLPGGMFIEAAYVGRAARNLLAGRDAMQPNLGFTDPASSQTWTQAATVLEIARAAGASTASIGPQPFFENLYSGLGARLATGLADPAFIGLTNTQAVYRLARFYNSNDWTTTQDDLDALSGRRLFYQPQYGALAVYSTIASSDYHGATLSIRQRFKDILTYDLNYTFSKSMDDVSGLQTEAPFTPFVLNAENILQQRAVSDFDVRHVINANAIWQIPIGRGRAFLSNSNSVVNGILGGWQLTGIFRWNSGLPVEAPLDFGGWPTNWNRRNYTVRIAPIDASSTRGGAAPANLFPDPVAAFHAFRSGRPGERGDRNIFRYPGYVALDLGLGKTWGMPWSENHTFQLRWEAFNVTNTQRLTSVDGFVQAADPFVAAKTPTGNFGNFTAIQGSPRVMQFSLRYAF